MDRSRPGSAAPEEAPPSDEGDEPGALEPEEAVAAFRSALEHGEPWYPALLEVIGRWVAAEETVDGKEYRYLVAGEAFDWLRLAQRLIEAADGLMPEAETERLLLFDVSPDGSGEEEFARAIGPQKDRARLNFRYGVTVEEALLLVAEQELQKAGTLAGSTAPVADVAAYERVYGVPLDELLVVYRAETGSSLGKRTTLAEVQAFTYWCWKYRLRRGEPARVASDTRKALALLSRMEAGRARLAGAGGGEGVLVEARSRRRG